jgi:hypothetical protein
MFPNKFRYFGVPFFPLVNEGWEDRGEVKSAWVEKDKAQIVKIHDYCKTVVHIGIQKDELFKFCPACLIKFTKDGKRPIKNA